MSAFKKTTNIDGKFKGLQIINGEFLDSETGEIINLPEILSLIYGESIFSLSTSYKVSVDIEDGDDNGLI